MSEFSESYHIRSDNIADGIALLQDIKLEGIVFPPTNGWVSFIVQGDLNEHIETVAKAWNKRLMHYMYAEDHAFMFNYFDLGDRVTGALATWEEELHIETEDLKYEILKMFLAEPTDDLELMALFSFKEVSQVYEHRMAYRFAQLMGITHYQWLGGGIMERPDLIKETLERSSGAEYVKV